MPADPFDVLRDRLVQAAKPRRRRLRLVVPIVVVATLSASAAAALTLKGHPSAPVRTSRYVVDLTPNMNTGAIGWCFGMTVRGVAGGRGCGSAGPPGTHLFAAGGVMSTTGPGLVYAVVGPEVATVVMGDRRVAPRRDPSVPAPWRVAVARVRGSALKLLDENGRELSIENTFRGRDPRGKAVDPDDPPDARCAIRAKPLPGLRAVSARLLIDIKTRPVIAPAYLTCATTVYYLGKWRVRVAHLLNANDLSAPAPPLPPSRFVSTRRIGDGWLVAYGADRDSRRRVLAAVTTRP